MTFNDWVGVLLGGDSFGNVSGISHGVWHSGCEALKPNTTSVHLVCW